MNKRVYRVLMWGSVAVVALLLVSLIVARTQGVTFHLQCGKLANRKDTFLDGSGRWLEHGSYHLGNGRRTNGDTHGVRLGSFYVVLGIKHTDPKVSPHEAAEDQ